MKAVLQLTGWEHKFLISWKLHYIHIYGDVLLNLGFSVKTAGTRTGTRKQTENPEELFFLERVSIVLVDQMSL